MAKAQSPDGGRGGGSTLQGVVRALGEAGRSVDVVGLFGAARGKLLAQVAQELPGRQVLAVCADEEAADALAADIAFFLRSPGETVPAGGEINSSKAVNNSATSGAVLRIPADRLLPYDELAADREAEVERLASLARLAVAPEQVRAVVVSARGLLRKVVPQASLAERCDLLGRGVQVDREALAKKLVELGYARVPMVEDQGTFAVRGGIVDLWAPGAPTPVRLDFFGDEIESCRSFEPESQRSNTDRGETDVDEILIGPAREALFTEAGKATAKSVVQELAERVDRPTSKVREVLESIDEGSPFIGQEALWPGFYGGQLATLFDYLHRDVTLFLDHPALLEEAWLDLDSELQREHQESLDRDELTLPPQMHFLNSAAALQLLAPKRSLRSHGVWIGIDEPIRLSLGETRGLRAEIEGAHGEQSALEPLMRRLEDFRSRGIAGVVVCSSSSAADRLKRLLEDRQQAARLHRVPFANAGELFDPGIHAHLFVGEISAGFVDAPGKLAIFSDEEIFGKRVKKRVRTLKLENAFAAAFRELSEGDLIVHVEHGIGRYGGLTKMQIRGIEGDFLLLKYDGADKLYLPVQKLRQVQKFTGGNPETVRLDKLGGQSFTLRKARVKEQLLKLAAELLDLYAARAAHPGFAYRSPDEIYREFEAEFPYEPTPDQQKAIDDVIADMTKARAGKEASVARPPMDRLVCGDVGYGKTEVAMRAAMLAVLSKKQVAILVPTTVLAAQHERTFRERFKGYPVRVEGFSRLKEGEEQRATLRDLGSGKIDIIIGTHRLLGSDVSFKDLGLIVIDEEHRFGVAHKERLKKLRKLVDVLTLTATPIPRTLNMSLAGARDMSIIATPPEDRRAIRTFVVKFDPLAVKDAIEQELARGGQVFFVHNRVRSLGGMEKFLQELVPQARIGVGHGQMGEGKLEMVMEKFVRRELDILLCTTIIESGIDIATANTIIVNRADQFGLAQLYQIRGRVGRSRERAYAHLLIPARRPTTKDAHKRLAVLQQFSELGAGFKIASHDLEIRGAGNILGKDQSGQIAAIGFDLYTELMDEAVRELRGEAARAEEIDPDVQLPLPAVIPDAYLPDVHQRLYFYKRFAQAATDEELEDVRAELIDRCGDAPPELDALTGIMQLKVRLRGFRIRALESGPGRLVFTLGEQAALDPLQLTHLIQKSRGLLRLTPEMKLVAQVAVKPPASSSPAALAAHGLELLAEARKVLTLLSTVALLNEA